MLGLTLAFIVALFAGITSTLNRSLKGIKPSIIMFFHGLYGTIFFLLWISIEAAIEGGKLRILSYTLN